MLNPEDYLVEVYVSQHDYSKRINIRHNIEDFLTEYEDKSYYDDEQGVEVLKVVGIYEPPFANSLPNALIDIAKSIFQANENHCTIEIHTVKIQDIPYEDHYFAKEDYQKLMNETE